MTSEPPHAAHLLAKGLGGVGELVTSDEARVHGRVEGVEREGGAGGDGGVVPERGGVHALPEREGGDLRELHRPREVRARVLLGVRPLEGADAGVVCRGVGGLHEGGVLVAHEELEVVERARADGVRHGALDAALLDPHVDDLRHEGGERQVRVGGDHEQRRHGDECEEVVLEEPEDPHSATSPVTASTRMSRERRTMRTSSVASSGPRASR